MSKGTQPIGLFGIETDQFQVGRDLRFLRTWLAVCGLLGVLEIGVEPGESSRRQLIRPS